MCAATCRATKSGVPQVVRIEEADERRVQLGQAAPDRAALAEVRLELDVAKAAVVELRQARPDRLVGAVGRGIVDDDRADIADGLPGHRLDGLCDKVAIVVIGDDHANSGSYRHSRWTMHLGSFTERSNPRIVAVI